MATAKLVRARRNADTARRIKNNWKKQFFEMRDQRDAARDALIELRNWVRQQYSISPHPIVTQPETNLPISGLGGYDQVLRDEFEDGKK